jgi:uncharacterized protein YndB with AHSA1/START domain
MSITSVDKDLDNLSITLTAEFEAPVEDVWQLWADPRKLERWWGPPTYPATVEQHDLRPGGTVTYYMTSPDGEKYHGWWRVTAVNPPTSLEFNDGFADPDGNPVPDMPVSTVRMQLAPRAGGTRMELRSAFEDREQMEKVLAMGVLEGMQESIGQMDALLVAV